MKRMSWAMLGLFFGGCLGGCKSQDTTAAVLSTLQQGQAVGELVLTTGGALSAGQQVEFFLGARDTSLTFTGRINFAEADFDLAAVRGTPAAKAEDEEPPGQ